jgi:hypothetical protein
MRGPKEDASPSVVGAFAWVSDRAARPVATIAQQVSGGQLLHRGPSPFHPPAASLPQGLT